MKLVGLMLARNEEWILKASIARAMSWVDELIVLDHASSDATGEIARQPGVFLLSEPHDEFLEMNYRQRMLEEARKRKATHIANIDADEVLTGNWVGHVREMVFALQPGEWLQVPMFCVWRSPWKYRQDGSVWSNRSIMLALADNGHLTWAPAGGYHHHNRKPAGATFGVEVQDRSGGVMHCQWVCWRRVVAKHAWYKMMERVRYGRDVSHLNQMYEQALDETDAQFAAITEDWWRGLDSMIDGNHVPWYEAECKRLWQAHPGIFQGLNLFGLAP